MPTASAFGVRRCGFAAGAMVMASFLVACDGASRPNSGSPPTPGAGNAATTAPTPGDASYTVRGVVATLPDARGTVFQVHHEAIPTFKNRDGAVNQNPDGSPGMKEMIMPFPLGPGVSTDGLKVGDAVEVTFEVTWATRPPYRVTKVTPLPAGTTLNLAPMDGSGASATPPPAQSPGPAPGAPEAPAAPTPR